MKLPTMPLKEEQTNGEQSKSESPKEPIKRAFGKHLKNKKILVFLGVLIIVLGAVVWNFWGAHQKSNTASYQEETVSRRDVQSKLTGTGTLEPLNQYNVTSLVRGEVISSTFSEGDVVKKGDLLYTIDSSDVQNNIEKSKLSLEQNKLSYEQQRKSLDTLSVKSNKSGVITQINVEVGDQVQAGSKIATVRDSTTMLLKVPFNSANAEQFYIGQVASVTVDGSFETLSGSVTQIDGADTVLIGNQIVRNVTVAVTNPGALSPSAAGSAIIDKVASNSGANFSYSAENTVMAEVSGKVKSIPVREGSVVSNGQIICTLESTSLENQEQNAALSVKNANLSLQSTIDSLHDYTVYAPISGTVVTKNTKVGDSIDSTSGVSSLAVIYDMSALKFDIALDELDVNQVKVGQEVEVSVAALDGKTFTGYITNISMAGTTSNGATTYPVTVQIDSPPADLLPGMNVNATIITGEAKNVISIPLEAVQRGNVVYVKGDGSKSSNDTATALQNTQQKGSGSGGSGKMSTRSVPEGFHAVQVKTGLSDDTCIEITSGLAEGDVVYLPQVSHETTSTQSSMMPGGMGGNMPGGMGGNMPGGMGGDMPGGTGGNSSKVHS